MPTNYETTVSSIDVSFFVYDPQAKLIFSETNQWNIFNYNENTHTSVFGTSGNSGAVISADPNSYFISFGKFSFVLSPLYHGATVSGVASLPSGSVSCLVKHNLLAGVICPQIKQANSSQCIL
jgi:hypothetical protein